MWPKEEYITCRGFPKSYLPIVQQAIDGKMVEWVRSSGFCASFTSTFKWAECEWELEELNEIVTGIKLIKGTIDPEVLTATVLKGKIETD